MKIIASINPKNKEDALKYAYAFMQTKSLNLKECSFINGNASKFDKGLLFPTDMYSAAYTEENMPTWENFKTNKVHISSVGFSCVACVDTKDKKRVMFMSAGDQFLYNCYGDYENEAKKALEDIVLIHSSLK